ncbi:MAG: hypothetical protein ACSLFQ_21525 [Thermoanaerobaculia bacterium]
MSIDEDRSEQRFEILRRIEGNLGKVEFVLCDIGDHGMHVQHTVPIRLGTEAPVRFSVPEAQLSVLLTGFVVWSRFASPGDTRPYHSGVRVDDPEQILMRVVERLHSSRAVRLDERSMERKRKSLEERARSRHAPRLRQIGAQRIPDDVILLVKQARQRLQGNPAEMVRWFNRAKFSLNEVGGQIHERDDVLAVWEYLERSVELPIIARVLDER